MFDIKLRRSKPKPKGKQRKAWLHSVAKSRLKEPVAIAQLFDMVWFRVSSKHWNQDRFMSDFLQAKHYFRWHWTKKRSAATVLRVVMRTLKNWFVCSALPLEHRMVSQKLPIESQKDHEEEVWRQTALLHWQICATSGAMQRPWDSWTFSRRACMPGNRKLILNRSIDRCFALPVMNAPR